jgi:hypothetical protein
MSAPRRVSAAWVVPSPTNVRSLMALMIVVVVAAVWEPVPMVAAAVLPVLPLNGKVTFTLSSASKLSCHPPHRTPVQFMYLLERSLHCFSKENDRFSVPFVLTAPWTVTLSVAPPWWPGPGRRSGAGAAAVTR